MIRLTRARHYPGVRELHLGQIGTLRREHRLSAAYDLVDDNDTVELVERWEAFATQQIIRTWGPRATPHESMRLPSEEELAAAVALEAERELEMERGRAQVAESKRLNAERVAAAHQRYEEMLHYIDEQRRKYGLSAEGREKYGFEPDPYHCRHCGGSLRGGRCHLCGAPV